MNEKDILDLIREDLFMMDIIRAADSMNLPDWLIGAGFVRNKVWDYLHGYTKSTLPTDIDLVYFDKENRIAASDVEQKLSARTPGLKWEIVNQATAHTKNNDAPYASCEDALSQWPETATAVGVKIENGALKLIAPLGIEDLVNLIVRPTPTFSASNEKKARVQERVTQKKWLEKWPKLKILVLPQ